MAYIDCKLKSQILGTTVGVKLYFPTDLPADVGYTVKGVLTLLHGYTNSGDDWMQMTAAPRYAADNGLVLVMPDCGNSFYQNMMHGGAYKTFVTEELPMLLGRMFKLPARREQNFIAGLSMGGYGAFKAALGAPQTFCAAASLSGALDVDELVRTNSLRDAHYWYTVFGDPAKIKGSQNDVFYLAEQCRVSGPMPRLYQWCGTEDSLYAQNVRLRDHLQRLGYDLTYEESPGIHRWNYWDEKIQSVLKWWEQSRGE